MLWFALIIGVTGSLHCIGMCGPITLFLTEKNASKFVFSRLVYNLGRVATYSMLGLVIGLFGESLRIYGIQKYASILSGVVLLVFLIISFLGVRKKGGLSFAFPVRLKRMMSAFLGKQTLVTNFTLGVLNGLLPCGLVFYALIASLNMPSVAYSVLFMMFFGLGTLPTMLAVALGGGFIRQKLSFLSEAKITLITGIFSLLLIVRGLGLGIPYLSPAYEHTHQTEQNCCTKHID